MQDQERLAELADCRRQLVLAQVVQELSLDRERPPPEADLGETLLFELVFRAGEQVGNVAGICRRTDRRDGNGRWHAWCSLQHCRAAE